jgi:class 3 adenylate cyclase
MIIPFAAILAMGAYFIALYVFQHEENSCLWLGVLCINFALRILSYDEFMLQDIFPFFPTALMFRLGYLTFAIALAGFAGFFRAQYPDQANRKIIHTIIGVALVYSLCDLFTPIDFFTSLLVPFQVFSLISGLYVISILVRAVIHREQGSFLLLAGFFVFFLIIVHDMMIANRMIDGVFLSHYGILCIIAAMALFVVSRFTGAFNGVEAATDELAKINASLFRFVPNEFLNFLGKRSITEVFLGDNVLKDMCVMFVHLGMDIELTSADSRRNMLEMFNDTLRAVNPVIQKHHGFVDKYLAEGLMVLFPDDPQSAVRCAVEIRGIMDAYNAERKAKALPCISFAAGLHCGSLMLGTIGESERMDSTVISDVVNTASRLLRFALSKGATIIVSEMLAGSPGFAESCGVSLLPHGEVMLKGRQQPIFVYEVRNP